MQSPMEETTASWKFSQCFGDKSDTIDVAEADVISTVKFDRTGDYLASGDRAGRVVLFQRNHSKKNCEYRFYTEFQSHEPEFDYLKSLEINERINKIAWCKRTNEAHFLLTTNDKTIKLWKVKERQVQAVVENNMSVAQKLVATDVRLPLILPKLVDREPIIAATPRRIYSNAHAYHVHSISLNSDEETFLSADDLRVNLWNINNIEQSFNVVDMKPASIEELTEVITTAQFHPQSCNLFAFGTSKGYVKLCDMRAAALCDRNAKVFKKEGEGASGGANGGGGHSFFSELISSISDLSFSNDGRYFVTRDYMNMKVWDLTMEVQPVLTVPVHDAIKPKLCDLYENDSIFDKFECSFTHDASQVMSGSYSNFLRFTSIKDGSSEVIQADKSIFRTGKKAFSKTKSLSSSSSTTLTTTTSTSTTTSSSNRNNKSIIKLDDPNVTDLDFERKILHSALHPGENTVAIAALCNLFIFSQVGNSNGGVGGIGVGVGVGTGAGISPNSPLPQPASSS